MDKSIESAKQPKAKRSSMGVNDTRAKKRDKPNAPKTDKDFPLWLHPSGRWCRKIHQKVHYFGKADNPQAALEKWLDQKDDLLAGRIPRAKSDGLLVGDPPHDPESAVGLVNRFLSSKSQLLATGEITQRTFQDYKGTCLRLVEALGWSRRVDDLQAEDFEKLRTDFSRGRGPVALGNEINKVKIVLKYAADNRLIPHPISYGQNFKRPSRKTLRIARAQRGPRIFEASEIKLLIAKASPQMRAMIHLGINCGLGQSDLSQLPRSAINFKTSWLNYPRPKTGIERRCWLWPETVKALKEAMPLRPAPKDPADDGLMFITKYGARWTRSNEKGISICNITQEFKKLLTALDINGHRGFYGLRRGFETIGGDSRDQVAVDFIMGHAPASNDMGAVYRDRLEDDRLVAVAQHVREWLFPKGKGKAPSSKSRTRTSRRGSKAARAK